MSAEGQKLGTAEIPVIEGAREVKCSNCLHMPVCAVYRAMSPLLNSFNEKARPIEVGNLAKICKAFIGKLVTV